MSSYGTVQTPPPKPDSFQDVTPGPLSYGSSATPKGASGERGWLPESTPASRCLASVEATITERGTKLGIRNPVALVVGTGCAVLVVLVLTLRAGPRLDLEGRLPMGGAGAAGSSSARHLQQLPCWTGSCDNWLFEVPAGGSPLEDAACDALAAGFGCNPCKRSMPSALQQYLNERVERPDGRVVVCPKPPSQTASVEGALYTAVPAEQYPEALGLLRLPCITSLGDCDYYLLQGDKHGFVQSEQVCSYWATTFGCEPECKTAAEAAATAELKKYVDGEGLLHASSRVLVCGIKRTLGMARNASGIEYTVREWGTNSATPPAASSAAAAASSPAASSAAASSSSAAAASSSAAAGALPSLPDGFASKGDAEMTKGGAGTTAAEMSYGGAAAAAAGGAAGGAGTAGSTSDAKGASSAAAAGSPGAAGAGAAGAASPGAGTGAGLSSPAVEPATRWHADAGSLAAAPSLARRVGKQEALRMLHLPPSTGATTNYLLEVDAQGLLGRNGVCNYWAAQFGCGPECYDDDVVRDHAELKQYLDWHKGSRIVPCATPPALNTRRDASGIGYTVREWVDEP